MHGGLFDILQSILRGDHQQSVNGIANANTSRRDGNDQQQVFEVEEGHVVLYTIKCKQTSLQRVPCFWEQN